MSTIAACMCAYCHQAQAPTVRDMICHPFHSCVEAAVELAVLCVRWGSDAVNHKLSCSVKVEQFCRTLWPIHYSTQGSWAITQPSTS